MIKTAGLTFDFYDDGGETLRRKLDGHSIPDFIKTASVLQPEDIESLPDHAFAVVLLNGTTKMRKYACCDKGNVAVNTIYFLEHHEKMPLEVQVKVASNLAAACDRFDLTVPESLKKIAAKKKTLIKMDGKEMEGRAGDEHLQKTSDLVGTEVMPMSASSRGRTSKVASFMPDPYIDVSRTTMLPIMEKQDDLEHYAIVDKEGIGHFPLRTYGEVKTAAQYFEENGHRMHPRRRHDFCVKVAAKADELGIPVNKIIDKYGSTSFGSDGEVRVGVELRRKMFKEAGEVEGVGLLDALMEKRASFEPDMFAETLAQLDIAMGIDRLWDKLPDPWYTTFGIEKKAAWSWIHGNERLSEEQLTRLLGESINRRALCHTFGEELVEEMTKKPTAIFESLPLEQQLVIARMAQQADSGL